MNLNELLDACREAMQPQPGRPEDGVTCQELQEALGVGSATARRILKHLIATGAAEPVKVTRVRMSGVPARTDGYRLKAA